jgi:hypothetical protein
VGRQSELQRQQQGKPEFHFCSSCASGRMVLSRLLGHGADLLEANLAFLVDQKGLGHAIDAKVNTNAPFRVHHRQVIGVTMAGQPFQPVGRLVL